MPRPNRFTTFRGYLISFRGGKGGFVLLPGSDCLLFPQEPVKVSKSKKGKKGFF